MKVFETINSELPHYFNKERYLEGDHAKKMFYICLYATYEFRCEDRFQRDYANYLFDILKEKIDFEALCNKNKVRFLDDMKKYPLKELVKLLEQEQEMDKKIEKDYMLSQNFKDEPESFLTKLAKAKNTLPSSFHRSLIKHLFVLALAEHKIGIWKVQKLQYILEILPLSSKDKDQLDTILFAHLKYEVPLIHSLAQDDKKKAILYSTKALQSSQGIIDRTEIVILKRIFDELFPGEVPTINTTHSSIKDFWRAKYKDLDQRDQDLLLYLAIKMAICDKKKTSEEKSFFSEILALNDKDTAQLLVEFGTMNEETFVDHLNHLHNNGKLIAFLALISMMCADGQVARNELVLLKKVAEEWFTYYIEIPNINQFIQGIFAIGLGHPQIFCSPGFFNFLHPIVLNLSKHCFKSSLKSMIVSAYLSDANNSKEDLDKLVSYYCKTDHSKQEDLDFALECVQNILFSDNPHLIDISKQLVAKLEIPKADGKANNAIIHLLVLLVGGDGEVDKDEIECLERAIVQLKVDQRDLDHAYFYHSWRKVKCLNMPHVIDYENF